MTTGCLFGHAADKQTSHIPPTSSDGAADGRDNEQPPLKRQKPSPSDLYDPFSPPVALHKPDEPPQPTAVTHAHHAESQSHPTAPIKQPTSASAISASIAPSKPILSKDTKTQTLAVAHPETPSSPPAVLPQRKPETLNPRLLKSAPATHGTRYKLLSMLHADFSRLNSQVSNRSMKETQLKRLVLSDQELIWMALDREQEVATVRAAIYSNIMKQDVMKYKRMALDAWIAERTLSLEKKAAPKNPSMGAPIVINTGLEPDQEAVILKRLITPFSDLKQYGYVPSVPTDERIMEAQAVVDLCAGWEKCDRCTARFQVFPGRNIETGELASGGKCTHHSGRQYLPERQRGDTTHIPKKYRCCEEDVGESLGCTVGQNHVWKTSDPDRLALLWNFVSTPANETCKHKAVAFDCEMGYTVHGMELLRLTAISWPDGAEILDVLVQPFGEVLDLNSKYSGVFPEDMARAVPWSADWKAPSQQQGERKVLAIVASPKAARDLFFSFISPETVLVGHGLENDLNAMRMIHSKIVDTVLLYPHRRGLPIRMGLKALMKTQLNKRIQVDTGEGHDSAEDARAAGDLVRLKVQKEWASMQSDGWKLVDGVFREPGWKSKRESEKIGDSDDRGRTKLAEEAFLGKT